MSFRIIEDGHIASPRGFRATGVSSGLKEVRARDLALVFTAKPAHAAAVFTTSAIVAAPVFFDQAVLTHNHERIHAVLINSGYANTGTGPQGLTNAIECAKIVADELEVPRDSVLLLSSGRAGVQLPMDVMRQGIRRAVSELDSGGGRRAALAILDGDTRPKERAYAVSLRGGRAGTLAGMAKGGRRGDPRQTATLGVLTTDLSIAPQLLARSLELSVARSFGRVSLDGGASPNDSVVLLANGASGAPTISDTGCPEYTAWQAALDALCADLALQVLRDAAAGGKVLHVHVRGAATDEDARRLARAVAQAPGVRAAVARAQPEWGALLAAVGGSGTELRADRLELRLGAALVMLDGLPAPCEPAQAIQALSGSEVELTVDLHLGIGSASLATCTAPGEP
jgi:glutamate N-acetyltransferase/amino-acid N-acetyltransferase